MATRIFSYLTRGYHGQLIEIEVEIRRGLPSIEIIGLAGAAVREARERVRFACQNAGFTFPPDRIVINLSPAGLAKQGTSFDLAIALAILQASGQVLLDGRSAVMVLGELGLAGQVSRIGGVLAALICARNHGIDTALVPGENLNEARFAPELSVQGISMLSDLQGPGAYVPRPVSKPRLAQAGQEDGLAHRGLFDRIVGQDDYRLALALSVAGAHHCLVYGPPGVGKTMGLNSLPDLWPALNGAEALEARRIRSLAGQDELEDFGDSMAAPFRMPHHSASLQAILGGGNPVRPGEVSLAHGGMLVLDEAPEFQARVLQGLREPLESGSISISRAGSSHWFPARCTLYLSMNPCPCGNLGRSAGYCSCRPQDVRSYWGKLGGPLLDRIDLRIGLFGESGRRSQSVPWTLDCQSLIEGIRCARSTQAQRNRDGLLNGQGGYDWFIHSENHTGALKDKIEGLMADPGLSRRGISGMIRLARTIADMGGKRLIDLEDIALARSFRETEADLPGFGLL